MKGIGVAAAGLAVLVLSTAAADAGGDPAKGQAVFKRCALCHTLNKGGPNRIGPNLHGLFDREAGKQPSFHYSAGLAKADFKWDDGKLDKWLTKPQNFIAGAKMPINVPNQQDRLDVISYLHRAAATP